MSTIHSTSPSRIAGIPFVQKTPKITSGKIFWVDSGTGSDSTPKGDIDHPFATIDYAIGKCTANKGDIIYVKPGHAETLASAAAMNCDVEGISIIGLGNGDNRPTITVATATTADFDINADNVLVSGLRFVAGVDSLENFITIGANYATIEDCEFIGGATYQFLCGINIETTFDNTTIQGCVFNQSTDPNGTDTGAGTGAIYLVDSENVTIEHCKFYGAFETALIHNKTTAAVNLWVRYNVGYITLSTCQIYLLVEGAIGGDIGSLYINPAGTDVTTAQLFGVESTTFFCASYFGNDSGGGQGAVQITAAT